MEEDKGRVCVTGGTGYLASWLIMRLLQHGYSVRATVRPQPADKGKRDISFLTNLPGASLKLQIFNAELEEPGSFDAAIEGCIGVFHVAHPNDFEGREKTEVISERAIEGTLGILNACLRSKTVKRVIYTSSSTAIAWNREAEDVVLDENAWSDVDFVKESKSFATPYIISKILTERAALEFARDHGLDLVSVAPSLVLGPFICPNIPLSVSVALAMIFGRQSFYRSLVKRNMVHIDDVASAFIFLFQNPHAKGRHICSSHVTTIEKVSEFLSAKYPEYQIPKADSLKEVEGYKQKVLSPKKLLDSGFKFKYGLEEMFDGAIQCCKEKGFL